MKLAEMTWKEVDAISRDVVVLIPTGSLEQHGPHLTLFTDSLLATSAGEAVERNLPDKVLLTPTLWLGASGHHLKFSGTLSASFDAYMGAIESIVESLIPHGFTKFYVINGHGGNTEPNGMVMRTLKAQHPDLTFGHSGYFAFIDPDACAAIMEGPTKRIMHSCEAEVSLIMHLHPDRVRPELLRNDGLKSDPPVQGVIHHFDEMTQEGSLGFAKLASAEKGKKLFDLAIAGATREIETIADGYVLVQNFTP